MEVSSEKKDALAGRRALLLGIVPAGVVVVAAAVLLAWTALGRRDMGFTARLPVPEPPPPVASTQGAGTTGLSTVFVQGSGEASKLPGDWPWFRGRDLDAIGKDKVKLVKAWPQGPKILWSLELGAGHGGAAVHNGRVYLLDYGNVDLPPKPGVPQPAKRPQGDILRCLSLDDGREIWRRTYAVPVSNFHGMSRTVPAVNDKYVVTLGPKCQVMCADAVTGEYKWGIDLVREYGTQVPEWYAGQCPLLDGDKVILGVGGKDVLMMAVDVATGKPVWQVPNLDHWQMTHTSIVPVTFHGKRMYIWCADIPTPRKEGDPPEAGLVMGVGEDGSVLFQTTIWCVKTAMVASPVPVRDGLIFLSGGYGAGSMMLELTEEGGHIVAKEKFKRDPAVFGAVQQTPILYQGYLYGVKPNGQLTCLDLEGKALWSGGSYGEAPFLIADGTIYVMNNFGVLSAVEATPAGFRLLGTAPLVTKGTDAWAPMAIVGGRLLARDLTRMVCVDLEQH